MSPTRSRSISRQPDPDFVYKLGHRCVPGARRRADERDWSMGESFPGTGPYMVADTAPTTRFAWCAIRGSTSWDRCRASRWVPRRDRLHSRPGRRPSQSTMVERGEADYTVLRRRIARAPGTAADAIRGVDCTVARQGRSSRHEHLHSAVRQSRRAPGRQLRDRSRPHGRIGGARRGSHLPASCRRVFPGTSRTARTRCDADAGGRWTAPDMEAAQRLIDASGTRGRRDPGPDRRRRTSSSTTSGRSSRTSATVVTLDERNALDCRLSAGRAVVGRERTQIMLNGWGADWVSPGNFLRPFKCPEALGGHIDQLLRSRISIAPSTTRCELQATDPAPPRHRVGCARPHGR